MWTDCFVKPNKFEVRKQHQINISIRFAALENLNDNNDINRAWKNIKENVKISAKDSLGCMNKSSPNNGLIKNVHNF
jgi:hypothetical protein